MPTHPLDTVDVFFCACSFVMVVCTIAIGHTRSFLTIGKRLKIARIRHMNTQVGWLIFRHPRGVTCTAVLGLAAALGSAGTAAQTDAAQMPDPSARRTELRSMVRQPQQSAAANSKAAELRHLSAEERLQLRRQLTRELRAQTAAVADASRP
jgi:hypothetical protein